MHELSIALNILDVVAEEADRRGTPLRSVSAIRVRVGPLSGVVKEALVSAFPLACEDTPFEHTNLVIEETPVVIRCSTCGTEAPPVSAWDLRCSACRNADGEGGLNEIVSGRELEIAALEIET